MCCCRAQGKIILQCTNTLAIFASLLVAVEQEYFLPVTEHSRLQDCSAIDFASRSMDCAGTWRAMQVALVAYCVAAHQQYFLK